MYTDECNGNTILPVTVTVTVTETVNRKLKQAAEYSAEFELAWSLYPKREGANKKDSYKAWNARLKSGVLPSIMIDGVKRYADYCNAQGTESRFIKQPATFFGPDEHYLSDWKVVASSKKTPAQENFASRDYGEGIQSI